MSITRLLAKTRRAAWIVAETYGATPAASRTSSTSVKLFGVADVFTPAQRVFDGALTPSIYKQENAVALAGLGEGLAAPLDARNQSTSLAELCGSIWLMAVPKQKRSLRVRRTRWNNPHNHIKAKHHISRCPNCGAHKMRHRTCQSCGFYGDKKTSQPRRDGYEWAQ